MTTITVSGETKKKIESLGGKGETFEQILSRVIENNRVCTTRDQDQEDESLVDK